MPIELTVPSVGESVTEVEVGDWLKQVGDPVRKDEPVVVIETDKATMEIFAPADGTVGGIAKPKGAKVAVGDVVGYLEPAPSTAAPPTVAPSTVAPPTASCPPPPASWRNGGSLLRR